MGDIGYRRKGDNTPHYHPERDYAYITPTLMRAAIEQLDAKDPPERARWRLDHGVTQMEIVKLAETLAKAQSDFVNSADPVKSFNAALERHGFFNFNYDVRQYLFSTLGEVFCAAWFTAVREVSVVNEESPAAIDMARFTAAVREFAEHNGMPALDAKYIADYRQTQNRILEAQLTDISAQLHKQRDEYYKLLSEFNALKKAPEETVQPKTGFISFFRNLFRMNNA
jgi:hypothetical protein